MSSTPDQQPSDPQAPQPQGEQQAPRPAPQFATVDVFVERLIAPLYERRITATDAAWCPMWWAHDGAVLRLTALWQMWEDMHVSEGPQASAKWLAYYADPIMRVLMDPSGTFYGCSPERGHKDQPPHPGRMLPCQGAPAGMFAPRP